MPETRSRSRGCLAAFLLIIILLAGIGAGVFVAVPKMLARAVKSNSVPEFFPEEITESINAFSANFRNIGPNLEQLGMDRQKLSEYVDGIRTGEIREFLNEFKNTRLSSPGELLTIAERNMGLPEMDRTKVENFLKENVNLEDLQSIQNRLVNDEMKTATSRLGLSTLKSMVTEFLKEE